MPTKANPPNERTTMETSADKTNRLEYVNIPSDINYDALQSLLTEVRQKLKRHLPKTIGQASRISGVSPSDINALIVLVGR